MKNITNIITVFTTEKGHIKNAVIQKKGKIRAHFIGAPELTKNTIENHPFSEKIDREQFSQLCNDFTLQREKKGTYLLKKASK